MRVSIFIVIWTVIHKRGWMSVKLSDAHQLVGTHELRALQDAIHWNAVVTGL